VQGDIESVAAKSPKELTTLFEHISGSEAFRADYNSLASEKDVRCGALPRQTVWPLSSKAAQDVAALPSHALRTVCACVAEHDNAVLVRARGVVCMCALCKVKPCREQAAH